MIIKRELGEKERMIIPKNILQEFLKDFFNVSKEKHKITTEEIKRIIMEQYEDEIHTRQ